MNNQSLETRYYRGFEHTIQKPENEHRREVSVLLILKSGRIIAG